MNLAIFNTESSSKYVEWLLRLGMAGTFLGHGILAFQLKPSWIEFITFWGFTNQTAEILMPIIGILDICIALFAIIKPFPIVLIYAFCWAFMAALMKPLTGEPIWEFIERASNWAVPLALYFLLTPRKK